VRTAARLALAAGMAVAGVGHFVAHESFLAQVPGWVPAPSVVVWVTGVMEIAFGVALVVARERLPAVGWALAAFFVAVFPGNVAQAVSGTPAFGLGTPTARWVRLLFQPLLVAWALWSTGAWPRRDRAR
jgi:uncharacterized membrane protein